MSGSIELNKRVQLEFEKNKTEDNLKAYVMSELLSPIEDKYNAIELLKANINLVNDKEMLFLAIYLQMECEQKETVFWDKLNEMYTENSDEEKAIIYYLEALREYKNRGRNEAYIQYLKRSIACSGKTRFVNNLYDLSKVSDEREASKLIKMARDNVEEVLLEKDLLEKPETYWLSVNRWIREFILGTTTSEVVYRIKFGVKSVKE